MPFPSVSVRIDGLRMYPSLGIYSPIDTIPCMGKSTSAAARTWPAARAVLFNPGAENEALERQAGETGIQTVRGCTLVMLKTGQF